MTVLFGDGICQFLMERFPEESRYEKKNLQAYRKKIAQAHTHCLMNPAIFPDCNKNFIFKSEQNHRLS